MELGVGDGENVVHLGRRHPDKMVIGVDSFTGNYGGGEQLALATIKKAGLDNTFLILKDWRAIAPSSAKTVISVAPGGTTADALVALKASSKIVQPGGKIYIGSVLESTFGKNTLSPEVLGALKILNNRGLSYADPIFGKGNGFDIWGYPLKSAHTIESYLIINVK